MSRRLYTDVDRARFERGRAEGARLMGRLIGVARGGPTDIERDLADPGRADETTVVRVLAALRPELRAELDRAKGAPR